MSFWQGLKDVLGPICGASVGALVTGLNLSKEGARWFLWSLCSIGFAALAISGGGPKKETPQLPAGGQQQQQQQAAQRQKRAPRQPNNRGARRGNRDARGGNRAARPGFVLAKTRRGEVRIYTPDSAIDVDYEVYDE